MAQFYLRKRRQIHPMPVGAAKRPCVFSPGCTRRAEAGG